MTKNDTRVTYVTGITYWEREMNILGFFIKITEWFMRKSTWVKWLLWFAASQVTYFVMIFVTIPVVENYTNKM